MDKLKSDVEYWEKQRARLLKDMDGMLKTKKKGGYLKYIVILGIGLIVGNVTSKYSGLQTQIQNQITNSHLFSSHPTPPAK
jgi:hypothetical protein